MDIRRVSVVGESFSNSDGSSRQAEIGRCAVGEPVILEREPDNPHDPKCVRVLSERGVQIGNIGRTDPWLCALLDQGCAVRGEIEFIGENERGLLGVVLTVESEGDPGSKAPAAAPGAKLAAAGQSITKAGCALSQAGCGLVFLVFVVAIVVAMLRG